MPGIYSARDAIIGVQGATGGRGGGASFIGAYDEIPSIVAAYGMRRLLTSYTGALVRLRRASDNAESDFGYDANGDLDVAAIATWLTATTGYAVTWYDQGGGAKNVTRSTTTLQPIYVASGISSLPSLRSGGTRHMENAASLDIRTSSAVVIAEFTGIVSNGPIFSKGAGDLALLNWNAGGTPTGLGLAKSNADWITNQGGQNTLTKQLVSYTRSGANATIYRNGTPVATTSSYAGSLTNNPTLQIGKESSLVWNADFSEIVIANAVWSAGSHTAAITAANAYWSIY